MRISQSHTGLKRDLAIIVMGCLLMPVLNGSAAASDKKKKVAGPDPTKLVWPLPPEQPRIRFVAQIYGAGDVEAIKKASFLDKVAGIQIRDIKPGFQKPYGVASDSKGRIYVSDSTQGTIFILDREHRQVTYIGATAQVRLRGPLGITVDGKDRLWVADGVNQHVYVFDAEGNLVWGLGKMGEMENPTGVAVDDQRHRAYVVDSRGHKLLVFDSETGMRVATIGKRGTGEGEFNFPTNVALSPDGSRIYVSDTMNFRVQIFDADYKFIRFFGNQGVKWGNFSKPKGIAVDPYGNIYVVDSDFCNFQIFEPKNFGLLLFLGGLGGQPGNFYLPAGIHVSRNNDIYVVDQINHRIQIFKLLSGEVPAEDPAPAAVASSSPSATGPAKGETAGAQAEPK